MTRKDYIVIADAIVDFITMMSFEDGNPRKVGEHLIDRFAHDLGRAYANFQESKFRTYIEDRV